MIRFVLILVFIGTLFGASDIDRKIKKTSSRLNSYHKSYKSLNKKMAQTAQAIIRQKKELAQQTRYLEKLKKELVSKEQEYKQNVIQLQKLKHSQQQLATKKDHIEKALNKVISKSVSLSVVLEKAYAKNAQSLVELEVLKAMLQQAQIEAKKLSKSFFATSHSIVSLDKQVQKLQASIDEIDAKQKKLVKTQKANKLALAKLQHDKESYKKSLKKLLREQNALQQTLDRLHIIKIDAQRRAREKKARKDAFAKKKSSNKYANSYQERQTVHYKGRKTIAPLKAYTVAKKYGSYVDPIYGIKIFNESVSLESKRPKAKVRTVFNGKVIYADKTAVLKNVIIIEHKNGLHTIYANLTQIAPGIYKGKKVKKGAIIGRIERELVFEVTQKSSHINPIELFR